MTATQEEPASLSMDDVLNSSDFQTIGQYLEHHAAKAPIEQHISFGLQVQRYIKALGLPLVRLPGQAPFVPLVALRAVHTNRYSQWDKKPAASMAEQMAAFCAELLGEDPAIPETGWLSYEALEAHALHHGHFRPYITSKDTPQARRAKLGALLQKYADGRLPNGLRLQAQRQRRSFYQVIRTASWKSPHDIKTAAPLQIL